MNNYHLLNNTLILGAMLFGLGILGFLTRRNLILMLMSAGLAWQGIVVTLAAFSVFHGHWSGHIFALFVLAVAAVQAVGILASAMYLSRHNKSLDVSVWRALRSAEFFPGIDDSTEAQPERIPDMIDPHGQSASAQTETDADRDRTGDMAP